MADEQFYYNPATGEVTEGKVASWDERMGPYPTRADAEAAVGISQARNKEADAAEEADKTWGKPASWEK